MLMHKEGKLKENQEFTDGQFIIKVHSKGKKKQSAN